MMTIYPFTSVNWPLWWLSAAIRWRPSAGRGTLAKRHLRKYILSLSYDLKLKSLCMYFLWWQPSLHFDCSILEQRWRNPSGHTCFWISNLKFDPNFSKKHIHSLSLQIRRFLFDWDSPLYKKYRIKVEILRRGVIAESTSRKEDAADIKAKRKSSRWGDENDKVAISAGTGNIPGMVLPPGMANPAAMNQSPQLMQYAIKVFGTTDLEESQWKQCEDQLKVIKHPNFRRFYQYSLFNFIRKVCFEQWHLEFLKLVMKFEYSKMHSLLKVKISAHRPNFFANNCLISIHLTVINENTGLLGHFKTTPMPLIL